MKRGFWPRAGMIGTRPGRQRSRSAHILQAKVDRQRLAQDIIDAFPQAADMSLPFAQAAVRAVGASTGARQWACQAAGRADAVQASGDRGRLRRRERSPTRWQSVRERVNRPMLGCVATRGSLPAICGEC